MVGEGGLTGFQYEEALENMAGGGGGGGDNGDDDGNASNEGNGGKDFERFVGSLSPFV